MCGAYEQNPLKPYPIAIQSVVVAALLLLQRRLVGVPTAELFSVVVFATAATLELSNRRERVSTLPHRGGHRLVAGSPLLVLAPWLPTIVPPSGFKSDSTVVAITLAATAAASVIYLSSLVDWFYVVPRMRGARGKMPCTHSLDSCWGSITRVWLLHRLTAMLVLVVANAAIVGLAANRWLLGKDNKVIAGGIAAAATVLAGYYLTRAASVIAFVQHPPLQVGDKIQLAAEFTETDPDRSYYVVDVALEGVRLLALDAYDRVLYPAQAAKTHDRVLDIADVARLLRSRRAFGACDVKCKHANPHCPGTLDYLPPEAT